MRNNSYVLITAARNEEDYIRKTLESVVGQTRLPQTWVIVSDGSTDRTDDYVRDFARRYEFIRLLRLDNAAKRAFSNQAVALNAAYNEIRRIEFDFVGFLDADVSLQAKYFEDLLARFAMNSRLGLAGGVILEERRGRLQMRYADSGDYVAGAIQLYRRRCYEDIGGFIALRWGGHDTVASMMARRKGWEVRAFTELRVCHHRRTTSANGSIHGSRFRRGLHDYFLGYHPMYELGKCIRRILEPPYLTGSVLRLCGYLWPWLKQEKPAVCADFVGYLRKQQMRRLFFRNAMQEEER